MASSHPSRADIVSAAKVLLHTRAQACDFQPRMDVLPVSPCKQDALVGDHDEVSNLGVDAMT